jgi:hypothetical protein
MGSFTYVTSPFPVDVKGVLSASTSRGVDA